MKAVIQRVSEASVTIDQQVKGSISKGFVILLGIESEDEKEDIDYLVKKVTNLRVFNDDKGKMNISLNDIQGEVLIISQFTLHANIKKGNRPSFTKAARPDIAIPLYEDFIHAIKSEIGKEKVQTGEFGADMKVSLINDGPVTILIDSKNR